MDPFFTSKFQDFDFFFFKTKISKQNGKQSCRAFEIKTCTLHHAQTTRIQTFFQKMPPKENILLLQVWKEISVE